MFCSIIIPVYNPDKEHFKKLIQSLKYVKDTDVLIVDDCSPNQDYKDWLSELLLPYTIITTPENLGPGLSREYGWTHCKSEWFTFVDHDDLFDTSKLSLIYQHVKMRPYLLAVETLVSLHNDLNGRTWEVPEGYELSTLHGLFLNKKKCEEFDIHFHPKLRAHEDLYFFNRMTLANIRHNKILVDIMRNIKIYTWNLWPESLSHNQLHGDYFLNTFDEYLLCVKEIILLANKTFNDYEERKMYTILTLANVYSQLVFQIQDARIEKRKEPWDKVYQSSAWARSFGYPEEEIIYDIYKYSEFVHFAMEEAGYYQDMFLIPSFTFEDWFTGKICNKKEDT